MIDWGFAIGMAFGILFSFIFYVYCYCKYEETLEKFAPKLHKAFTRFNKDYANFLKEKYLKK